MAEKSAAVLTIKAAPDMTEESRKDIAKWLRRQAGFLVKHGDELSSRFRARYVYLKED